jgi:hypothetical protein
MKATETGVRSALRKLVARLFQAPDNVSAGGLVRISCVGTADIRRLGEQHRAQYFAALLRQKRDEAAEPQAKPTGPHNSAMTMYSCELARKL